MEVESSQSRKLQLSSRITSKSGGGQLAGFSPDGSVAWIANGPHLQVLDAPSQRIMRTVDFESGNAVSCCCFVVVDSHFLLLVALRSGRLVMIDLTASASRDNLEFSLRLPSTTTVASCMCPLWRHHQRPLSTTEMAQEDGTGSSTHILTLHERIAAFGVPVVIGTMDGSVLIIDVDPLLGQPHSLAGSTHQLREVSEILAESRFSQQTALQQRDVRALLSQSIHPFVVLNVSSISGSEFRFQTDDRTFQMSRPQITSLHVVPQMNTLAVGFSFSGFQLWSLASLNIVAADLLDPQVIDFPITQFCYQQIPSRALSRGYLWIVQSSIETRTEQSRFAKLHFLIAEFGNHPKISLKKTFSRTLSATESSTSVPRSAYSRMIFVAPIPNALETEDNIEEFALEQMFFATDDMEFPETVTKKEITRAAFVWETVEIKKTTSSLSYLSRTVSSPQRQFHMEIFDLNRWLSSDTIVSNTSSLAAAATSDQRINSCFIYYPISKIPTAFPILSVNINEHTVDQVILSKSAIAVDFPRDVPSGIDDTGSTGWRIPELSFESSFLTTDSLHTVRFVAPARKVLNDLARKNTMVFAEMELQNLHQQCVAVGLIRRKNGHTFASIGDLNLDLVLNNMLSLLLQNNLVPVIANYINAQVASPEDSASFPVMDGPFYMLQNPRPVFEWVLRSFAAIDKQATDRYAPLLEESGVRALEPINKIKLQQTFAKLESRLEGLQQVVEALMGRTHAELPDEKAALEPVQIRLFKFMEYLRVMEWFIGQGLLPLAAKRYDATHLLEMCERRRTLKSRAIASSPTAVSEDMELENQNLSDAEFAKLNHTLFIDKLMAHTGTTESKYPPSSLVDLLDIFMIPEQTEAPPPTFELEQTRGLYRHLVLLYFIIDCVHSPGSLTSFSGEDLNLFVEQFSQILPAPWQKLLYGLWILDARKEHCIADVVGYVCSPDTPTLPSTPFFQTESPLTICVSWYEHIIEVLLSCGDFPSAMKVMRAKNGSASLLLQIKVLLANNALVEAFSLQRKSAPRVEEHRMLLYCIFEHAMRENRIPELFLLPFSESEDVCLARYLTNTHNNAADLLFAYLVSKCRYSEAVHLYHTELDLHGTQSPLFAPNTPSAQYADLVVKNLQLVLPEVQ